MSGIQPTPPTYEAPAGGINEKQEYNHVVPDHQQPQQTYQQTGPQQSYNQQELPQQIPPQGTPQNQPVGPKQTYLSAVPLASLQQGPSPVDCPACGVRALTKTEFVTGGTTHLAAALCCFCFLCGCVPYLASWFKDCEHKCGNCGALLAVWHRSGRTEVMAHAQG